MSRLVRFAVLLPALTGCYLRTLGPFRHADPAMNEPGKLEEVETRCAKMAANGSGNIPMYNDAYRACMELQSYEEQDGDDR